MKSYIAYKLPNSEHVVIQKGIASNYNDISQVIEQNSFIFNSFNNHTNYKISALEDCQINEFEIFTKKDTNYCIDQTEYLHVCNQLIDYLKTRELRKVILSRLKKIKNTFIPIELFKALNTNYKNTFNYIISIDGMGCWIGSTPEILLTKNKTLFKTVSIAGTKHSKHNEWGVKEIEEQQIVTDYISSIFKKNAITFSQSEAHTIKAGHVFHLKTEFEGEIKTNFPKLIYALHPTPATCGLPKFKAKAHIESIETHDRKFYTGFLGPTSKENTSLFVNLRCIEVQETHSYLYLGGGIISQSVAKEEWIETENKANTLLSVINGLQNL